jgi:DNA-binding CsgD family transcriptional regulator
VDADWVGIRHGIALHGVRGYVRRGYAKFKSMATAMGMGMGL